MVLFMR